MQTNSLKTYGKCCLMLVPCLLVSCLPQWQDICLLFSFLVPHGYILSNIRGMLILSTFVLLLWTKNLFTRWYRSQVLTQEFLENLLYLGLTVVLSLVAVMLVWMPLYEAYGCVVSKLDRGTAQMAMEWRNAVFLLIGVCMATSAVTHTDLVLRPSQMDNTGQVRLVRRLSALLGRIVRVVYRQLKGVLKSFRRCVHIVVGEFCTETKVLVSYYSRMGGNRRSSGTTQNQTKGDDVTEGCTERTVSSTSATNLCTRQTRSMTRGADTSSTNVTQCTYTRRLRSHGTMGSGEGSVPDCQYDPSRSTTHCAHSSAAFSTSKKNSVVDATSQLHQQFLNACQTRRSHRNQPVDCSSDFPMSTSPVTRSQTSQDHQNREGTPTQTHGVWKCGQPRNAHARGKARARRKTHS